MINFSNVLSDNRIKYIKFSNFIILSYIHAYNIAMLVNATRNMHNINLNFYDLHISNKYK